MVASMWSCLLCVVILAFISNGVENFDIKTVTKAGTVLGNRKYVIELNKNVDVYLGVQYAAAPIDDLRYKAPKPLPNIQTNFLGREIFAPSCPQGIIEIFPDFPFLDEWTVPPPIDEDCLYLNIWKPENDDITNRKPVIVFIHGGGYEYGSSSIPLYDGKYLSAWTDAIFVTVQYRLGALGFLYTGDGFAPGNAGLKDQALAIGWIHHNIDSFGGDRDKITVIGQSAGAASVGFHLLNAETSKLFKRAVLLSGAPNSEGAAHRSETLLKVSLELAGKLGATLSSYEDIKRHLLDRKWQDIVNAQGQKNEFNIMFVPAIGASPIPEHPLRLLDKAKHLKEKEIIATWIKNDGSIFVVMDLKRSNKIQKGIDIPVVYLEDFKKAINDVAGKDESIKEELVKIYNETVEKPYLKGWIKMIGDYHMTCPINQFIQGSRNRGAKVYHGEYNYRPKTATWPDWIGVYHGSELTMLFGLPIHQERYTHEDRLVHDMFMGRIKEFVHRGNPNKPSTPSWFEDRMFVISDTAKEYDNRTDACSKLKKLLPNYGYVDTSGASSMSLDVFGYLPFFLVLPGVFL